MFNKPALIQEDQLDNTLTSTQVKTIGEGFQLEIKRGEQFNLNKPWGQLILN